MKESNVSRLIERAEEFVGGLAVFNDKKGRITEQVRLIKPIVGGTGAQIHTPSRVAVVKDQFFATRERTGRIRLDRRNSKGAKYIALIPAHSPRVMAMAA